MKFEEAKVGDKISYKDDCYIGVIKEVKISFPSWILVEVKSANLQKMGLKTVPELVRILNGNIQYVKKINTMETE